jgi:hypothetical protein
MAMSLSTWKQEFYPVPADSVKDDAAAVEHSIRKWEGLRKENLVKHAMRRSDRDIGDDRDDFGIDCRSCALCVLHRTRDKDGEASCGDCPLYVSRGKVACDVSTDDETIAPYRVFMNCGDPEPMLAALALARAHVAGKTPDTNSDTTPVHAWSPSKSIPSPPCGSTLPSTPRDRPRTTRCPCSKPCPRPTSGSCPASSRRG